jgi:hypothetical protein
MTVMEMPILNRPLEAEVLEILRREPLRPTGLVQSLQSPNRGSGREIENALSALLDNGSVMFESDGLLHAV